MYYYLLGATAFLAQASFSNTIGLGSVLVGIMIVIGFAWASRKDQRSQRWEKLYDLADTERKEIQSSLDEAVVINTEQKEVIQKLDALQMPIRIVELMNDSVTRIDTAARTRLEDALGDIHKKFEFSEERAQERHEIAMEFMLKLVERVEALVPAKEGGE